MRSSILLFALVLGCSSPFSERPLDNNVGEQPGQGGEASDIDAGTSTQPDVPSPEESSDVAGAGGTETTSPSPTSAGASNSPSSAGTGASGGAQTSGLGGHDDMVPMVGTAGVGGVQSADTIAGMGGAPVAGMGGAAGTGSSAGTASTPSVGAGGSTVNEPLCLVQRVHAGDPGKRGDCLIYNVPGCPDVLRLSLPVGSTYQIDATFIPQDGCDMSSPLAACLSGTTKADDKYPVLFSFKGRLLGEVRVFDGVTSECFDGSSSGTCHICYKGPTSVVDGQLTTDEVYDFDMAKDGITTPKSS